MGLGGRNYSHGVPVDDVGEFHAKLDQADADRTKGRMITPIGYEKGAFEYARSKGISLWRYNLCFAKPSLGCNPVNLS